MLRSICLKDNLSNCCGCGACAVACPVDAITMAEDAMGCLYPDIDRGVCIDCGKCTAVCGFASPVDMTQPKEAFAAVGKKEPLVQKSASGGVFATVAEQVLAQGGMIAGAVMTFDEGKADVFHVLADKQEDISLMQGSKYVQSDACRCYEAVQCALKQGRTVLFSGTPCQVAAIKALTGDPEQLVTMDLICHGVPTKEMLNGYLNCLGKYLGGAVIGFSFRDKTAPKPFTAKIKTKKGTFRIRSSMLSYYSLFLKGSIYRESCYSCPYACGERDSDLTIGDYWGIEDHHNTQDMPNVKDWSCLLVNTDKGRRLLETCGTELDLHPTEFSWVRENNLQLNAPSRKTENRETLLRAFREKGYGAVEKAFVSDQGGILRYRWRLRKHIRRNKG